MELVQMARDAGAAKVYFASAAPPVRYVNVYGVDIPTKKELIAHGRTEAEISSVIGADSVVYNDLEDLIDAVRSLNPSGLTSFDCSCFNGVYITGDITAATLEAVEQVRGGSREGGQSAAEKGNPASSLHNYDKGC